MVAQCPMDGCDYTGPTRSVEAHLSGSSDEAHQGQLGRNWRSTIEASHADDGDQDEQPAEATQEATEAPTTETSEGGIADSPAVQVLGATVALALVVLVSPSIEETGPIEEDEQGAEEEVEETDDGTGVGWTDA